MIATELIPNHVDVDLPPGKIWQFVPAEPSTTHKALLDKHGPLVPLGVVAETYLANTPETARRKAVLHQLPFPALQLEQRRKAPWFVRAAELADWIDRNALKEHAAWQNSQL